MNAKDEMNAVDLAAIDDLYNKYKADPESVDESFRYFFQGFDLGITRFPVKREQHNVSYENSKKELAVMNLITAYRRRGHLFTKTEVITRPLILRISTFPKAISTANSKLVTKWDWAKPPCGPLFRDSTIPTASR